MLPNFVYWLNVLIHKIKSIENEKETVNIITETFFSKQVQQKIQDFSDYGTGCNIGKKEK